MAFRDLLLAVVSYPDPTPPSAIRNAVRLARKLGGSLTAVVLEAEFPLPANRLANALAGLDKAALVEEARSAEQGSETIEVLAAEGAAALVSTQALISRAPLYLEGDRICEHARTRDLCLTPVGPVVQEDRTIAETVLLGSGRPILAFAEDAPVADSEAFQAIAIAWDGSACAARAVADALPLLRSVRQVRILVVTDEKPSARSGMAHELIRHLQAHGVAPFLDEVSAAGEPIGRVLGGYVAEKGIDLLVMGGFGHARVREFVLGGATRSMLEAPPCPVLMSH